MLVVIINVINFIVLIFTILIILKVFLSYFLAPYHPVRLFIDRLIDPLLRPIQRFIPPLGGLDLSPLILLIIVQILGRLLISVLSTIIH